MPRIKYVPEVVQQKSNPNRKIVVVKRGEIESFRQDKMSNQLQVVETSEQSKPVTVDSLRIAWGLNVSAERYSQIRESRLSRQSKQLFH